MKYSEIKKMKDAELVDFIKEKKEILRSFRFGNTGHDMKTLRSSKTGIAQALTELSNRNKEDSVPTTNNVE